MSDSTLFWGQRTVCRDTKGEGGGYFPSLCLRTRKSRWFRRITRIPVQANTCLRTERERGSVVQCLLGSSEILQYPEGGLDVITVLSYTVADEKQHTKALGLKRGSRLHNKWESRDEGTDMEPFVKSGEGSIVRGFVAHLKSLPATSPPPAETTQLREVVFP